jgi:hypothetical protein
LVRDLMARINNNVNFFITCRQVHQEYCTEWLAWKLYRVMVHK